MQEFELKIIQFVQSFSSPFLDKFFETVTMLGEETFYILIFCFIYWCYDKSMGKGIILTFLFSNWLNAGLKAAFNMPRPIGNEGVRSLRVETATGSSFPSGHTQSAATFFYYSTLKIKKIWFTVLAWVLILLVGLSRVYLGVHWPKDVVAGIIIAVLVVHFGRKFFGKISLTKMIITLAAMNVLLIFFHTKGFVTSSAVFTGGMIGLFLEEKYVNYEIKKGIGKNIIKFILGLAVVMVIKEGVKMITPDILVLHYIRYWLIGIWVSFAAMAVFKKIKI